MRVAGVNHANVSSSDLPYPPSAALLAVFVQEQAIEHTIDLDRMDF